MIINVRDDGSVGLVQPEDTRSFKLVAPHDMSETRLTEALAGVAEVESGYAWVHQPWVQEHSPLASSDEWQKSFGKMLDFARSKNWLREADEAIRAHIERR